LNEVWRPLSGNEHHDMALRRHWRKPESGTGSVFCLKRGAASQLRSTGALSNIDLTSRKYKSMRFTRLYPGSLVGLVFFSSSYLLLSFCLAIFRYVFLLSSVHIFHLSHFSFLSSFLSPFLSPSWNRPLADSLVGAGHAGLFHPRIIRPFDDMQRNQGCCCRPAAWSTPNATQLRGTANGCHFQHAGSPLEDASGP